MTSFYTGAPLMPMGQQNPSSGPFGNGIAGLPTSTGNPFTQNPYTPVGGGFLSPYAQQPSGNAIGNRQPSPYTADPYAPRPVTGGGDARPMYPHNTYPSMETPQPMYPGGRGFYGFGDDLPMVRADDNVPQGGGGFLSPSLLPANPQAPDQNTYNPQIANQLMPTQAAAPVRNDIMYGASPTGGYNPFFANGLTQGQAAAQTNTTTTTPTTTPVAQTYGFTGTNPFIERGLNEAEFKARSVGMAAGGLAGLTGNAIYPQSRTDATQYAVNTQLPTSSEVVGADYDAKTNSYTGMPYRFAKGGIAGLRFVDGGEIDPEERQRQINEVPSWNPEEGQVKLQTIPKQGDRDGEAQITDYTIPKDQIKDFASFTDPNTGVFSGAAYTMKDGSTLGVDKYGIVQQATPGRNDYKLNEQGYYQPVGANLTWDGGLNQLTKKIGGVDVLVPGQFHKGGYQDDKGNLRVDENGVPIPLLPNYLDSGMGKSGLADAAPYITAAMMAAATMGASAPASAGMLAGETAFAGMVPASETLLGSMGYLGTAAAPTIAGAETLGSTVAPTLTSTAPTAGGITALDAGTKAAISAAAAPTYGSAALPYGITSVAPATSATMLPGAAALQAGGTSLSAAAAADIAAKTATMTPMQKYVAATMAAKALSSGSGGGGGGGPTSTTTTTSTPQQQYPQQNYPQQQYPQQLVMSPYMTPMNTSGAMYNPLIYGYNTRRAAQGGMMHASGSVADLGGYAAGGKLLKGPGDGMSDDIVANIAGKQPARLADGEFVVPADVVSHLGNGSTDAGAKHLYKMMDRIRQARTGNSKQGKRINPNKFLPKG